MWVTVRKLHWLPVKQRITYKIASITYRTCHSSQPVYLRDLLTNYQPARTLRSPNVLRQLLPLVLFSLSASRRLLFGTTYLLLLKLLTLLMFLNAV